MQLAEQCRPAATDGSSSAAHARAAALRRMHGLLVSHLCQAHVCDKRRKRTHLMAVAQVGEGSTMAQATECMLGNVQGTLGSLLCRVP